MSEQLSSIVSALEPLRAMLTADGYELRIQDQTADVIVAEIAAGPDACAECLVPKEMMRAHFEAVLRSSLAGKLPEVRLIYPADGG